jgi:hypothetical protein
VESLDQRDRLKVTVRHSSLVWLRYGAINSNSFKIEPERCPALRGDL